MAVAITAAALALVGCRAKEESALDAGPPVASALPVDRLAPGELPEGKERALGLVLPEGLRIARAFDGVVFATSSTLKPEAVSNYFRARVTEGNVLVGAEATNFVGVKAKSDLARTLAIEIKPGQPGVVTCEVLLRDVTPPPLEPNLTEDERRRKAGLTPDGKLLDPQHLE